MRELLQCGCDCNLGPVEKKVVELMRLHTPPYEILRVLGAAIDNIEGGDCGIVIDTTADTLTYNGKVYKLQVDVKSVIRVDYSDIYVELEYKIIDAEGGTVTPSITYYQTKTTTYNDGSQETETIRDGAEMQFGTSVPGAQIDINTGTMIVGASTLEREGAIGSSTLIITLNGISKMVTVQIRQAAKKQEIFKTNVYVGAIDVEDSDAFSYVGIQTLVNGAERIEVSREKTGKYTASKPAFFMLVPADAKLISVTYGSEPLITNITGLNLWNTTHDDVEIDGKTYKVYGYYSGMVDADNNLVYDYKLNTNLTLA